MEAASSGIGLDKLLTIKDIAGLLGVCERTVRRHIAAGKLIRPIKVGRLSKWTLSEVEEYIERCKEASVR